MKPDGEHFSDENMRGTINYRVIPVRVSMAACTLNHPDCYLRFKIMRGARGRIERYRSRRALLILQMVSCLFGPPPASSLACRELPHLRPPPLPLVTFN